MGNAGAVLGGMLCGLVIGLMFVTLVGAVILRAGIGLYNSFAGRKSQYPEPEFSHAMGIIFIVSLVNFGVNFVFGYLIGDVVDDERTAQIAAGVCSIPIAMIVMAGILSTMLEAEFVASFIVTICYYVVSILIVLMIVGTFLGIALFLGSTPVILGSASHAVFALA